MTTPTEKILILDFGSQTTQLIARRVRELGVYSEIYACDVDSQFIKDFNPKGIILSGGPDSVTIDSAATMKAPDIVFKLGCPVLGICYGMQTMAQQLGGKVESSDHREFGHANLLSKKSNILFNNIFDNKNNMTDVWMSHGDKVIDLPNGFEIIAKSKYAPIAAMANTEQKLYGLQFHPEVTHTECGSIILSNFIHNICGCGSNWVVNNIVENISKDINAKLDNNYDEKVLLALSGGVDSTVLAALLHKAIGDRLVCVFVDNGLLRDNEVQQVVTTLKNQLDINLITVDARANFLNKLKNITCPEEKRKIIGHEFIEVFTKEAKKLNNIKWFAQGTIYPDVIESAGSKTGKATVIKSHHNVGGLPDYLPFKLLEPFRELFKDEIRNIGLELGLPHEIIYRHPFPGPGLAVRVLGEVKEEYLTLLRQADKIFIELLKEYDWYDKVSQAFVVFIPCKSVAVLGDARSYEYVVALRAVTTQDFMSANWAGLPHDLLAKASNRIINEVPGIARVTYDISSKPPATIEWE